LFLKGRYDYALPAIAARFYPSGLMVIGLAALLAGFMSDSIWRSSPGRSALLSLWF